MLSTVSWGQYITAIIILLVCYYLYVGIKYFRWEILSLAGINKVDDNTIFVPARTSQSEVIQPEKPEDYLPKSNIEIDISPVVKSFTDEVRAYLQEAKSNVPKPELIYSLKSIAAKYPALRNVDFGEELLAIVFSDVNNKYPGLFELSDFNTLLK